MHNIIRSYPEILNFTESGRWVGGGGARKEMGAGRIDSM